MVVMRDGIIVLKTNNEIFTIADFCMWMFMFLTFFSTSISSATVVFRLRLIFLIIAGILGFTQLFFESIRNVRIIWFVLLCISSWSISFMLRCEGAYEPNLFLYSLLYMGVGINLTSHHHNDLFAGALFYTVCGITLFRLIVLNEPIRGFLKDGTSYNFISVMLLLFLCYYCIELIQNNKPIPYLAALLFTLLCFIAYGRGGIITGVFFFVSTFFSELNDPTCLYKKNTTKIVTILLAVICVCAFSIYILEGNYSLFRSIFAKFYVGDNLQATRLDLWSSYIKEASLDITTMLFGADIDLFMDRNLHNAFLQMHSSLGLIPLIVLLYACTRLTMYAIKEKKLFLLCIMATMVIRSMTDKTAFQGYCEPMLYSFVFMWFNITEKKRITCYDYRQ